MGATREQTREREWKPRLKHRSRKASVSANESSQAASAAMQNIKTIGRRRDQGHDVDDAFIAKMSRSLDPAAADRKKLAAASGTVRTPGWFVGAAAGAACTLAVVIGMAAYSWSGYSVAGVVLANQRPLANATVSFHLGNSTGVTASVTTSTKGTFENARLPAGMYKVTVQPAKASPDSVATIYTKPESTRLRLRVEKNVEHVWMNVTAAR